MQIKDVPNFGILIIVTIMIFGVGAVALQSFSDSTGVYITTNRLNNSFTNTNNTFTVYGVLGDDTLGFTQLRNSSGALIGSGNYTIIGSTINISGLDVRGSPSGLFYVDYTYKGGAAYNMTKSGNKALLNVTDQFSTMGLIAGVLLIIGTILAVFMYRKFV